MDDTQHIVIGVVYQPDVEDAHGDMMDAVEIEKAAHCSWRTNISTTSISSTIWTLTKDTLLNPTLPRVIWR
ncbi:XkdF-like putative serine protease domain-containing protein [Paenibacillus sp. FSL R7-0026]|uniref:XkdF-like putative serine protease domain-containing protein n=1 Tax=Paenibacillus sp. FSL R7-0026 TaxID=2921668 RepID=UPI0030F6D6C6